MEKSDYYVVKGGNIIYEVEDNVFEIVKYVTEIKLYNGKIILEFGG